MKIEMTEVRWVDQHAACTLAGLESPAAGTEPRFAAECLVTVRAVGRLRRDFDLDAHGVSVALALIERIEALERQLRAVRAQLPDRAR